MADRARAKIGVIQVNSGDRVDYVSYLRPSVQIKDPVGKRGGLKAKYEVREVISYAQWEERLDAAERAKETRQQEIRAENAAGGGPKAEARRRIRKGISDGFREANLGVGYNARRFAPTKSGKARKIGTSRDSILKNTNTSVAVIQGYALNPENRAVLNKIYGDEIASAYKTISNEFNKYAATLAANTPGGVKGPARYAARKDTDAMKPWEKKFYVNQVIPKKEKALATRVARFANVKMPPGAPNPWREYR